VEVVDTDGSESYTAAIVGHLPAATHILDRFHVVRVRHEAPCSRGRVRDPPLRAVAAAR